MKTGWTEEALLRLPAERLNTYIEEMNAMYGDKIPID